MCKKNSVIYIDNSNVTFEHLNGSRLHLNDKGSAKLESNFRDCIKARLDKLRTISDKSDNNVATRDNGKCHNVKKARLKSPKNHILAHIKKTALKANFAN